MIENSTVTSWKAWGRTLAEGVARALVPTGATPNALTLLGLALTGLVAVVVGYERFALGGALLLLVALLDTLDGALARVTNQKTSFGAFLDSVTDRYAEAFILLGIVVASGDALRIVVLCYAAAVGSLMVSYTRARAEGLGLRAEVGLLARAERVILLGLGLLTGYIEPVLLVLAVFTNVTAVQRIIHVYRLTGGR